MEYTEHYSNSLNNDIDKETQEIARIIYDYEIIIKLFLIIILIYAFVSNIFIVSADVINNNYKLYAVISLIIILYVLYKFDIIELLKLLIFLSFISFIVVLLYYNLEKLEFIILFYYSFNYQLEKIYNETKTNYNEILFSFIFIAIISIISIVLYWDNIYTDSKKLSKCGKIINTIENNNKNKKPFVYNIIIINNDLIDTTTSKYVLKITYDFMKKKTIVNYGTDNGYYTDGSESFKKQGYISLKDNENKLLNKNRDNDEKRQDLANKELTQALAIYNTAITNEGSAITELDTEKAIKIDSKTEIISLKNIRDKALADYTNYNYKLKNNLLQSSSIDNKQSTYNTLNNRIKDIEKRILDNKELALKDSIEARKDYDNALLNYNKIKSDQDKYLQLQNDLNTVLANPPVNDEEELRRQLSEAMKNYGKALEDEPDARRLLDEKKDIKTIKEINLANVESDNTQDHILLRTARDDLKNALDELNKAKAEANAERIIVLNTKREEYIRANADLELKKLELNCYLANSISILKDKKREATTDKNNKKILYDNAKEEYDNIIESNAYNNNKYNNKRRDIDILDDIIKREEKELVFFYFNLKTMKSEKIENIDANILNEERFKYILVDDDNNKLPYDDTVVDLIKFTKIYSRNENYNINIINDIIYAKNNREKLFI
jgi:hypothetical protein